MSDKIVDIDSHLIEPADLWEKNLESEFRDRAMRLRPDENGLEVLEIDGKATVGYYFLPGLFGRDSALQRDLKRALVPGQMTYADSIRNEPGAIDPHARVKVMDSEGIDISVLYPTWALSWDAECPDRDLAMAYARVYNDWVVDEFCGPYPDRLIPIAHIPIGDVGDMVRELERSVKKGAKGVMLLSRPPQGGSYGDPAYDPFWAAAEALNAPIGLHVWGNPKFAGSEVYPDASPELSWWTFINLPIDVMFGFASLLNGGTLDRFPKLQVIVLETGGGLLPYWMERFDELYEIYGFKTEMKLKPSEYFARQCWVSVDPGTKLIPDVVKCVGAERVLWAADYPHADASFGTVEEIKKNMTSLSADERHSILTANGLDLYGLN